MDPRERLNDFEESFRGALDGRQASIWTCMPGEIVSYDSATQTASVQLTIQEPQTQQNGTGIAVLVNLPRLVKCPVKFPCGGGFTMTFPIKSGDECEVSFSSRAIDSWWQLGGIQPPAEFRMHDLSDGFVEVGPRSQANLLSPAPSTTSAQFRSDDGAMYVELAEGHICTIIAPGGINLNGVTIDSTGKIISPADIIAGGPLSGTGVSLLNHTHQNGGGTGPSGPPTPGS